MTSTFGALLRTELRVERRTGDALLVTAPFAAAGLLVVAIAVGADTPLLRRIGPGVYWSLTLLFGALVTLRRTLTDAPERRDLLTLLGVDAAVQWLARATAAAALVIGFEVLLLPVLVVLYDPPLVVTVIALGVLAGLGIGALGTWASDLATGGPRSSLVPLIVTPLGLPLVLAAVQVQDGAQYGASPWPWLLLAATTDLVILLVGTVSARALKEQPT